MSICFEMELALRIGCNNRMLFESDAPRDNDVFCGYARRKTLMAIHGVLVRLTEKDGYEEGV